MSDWTTTTLATLDSISKHEQEINELAGKKTRPVLYWNGDGTAPTVTFDTASASYVKSYNEAGFAAQRSLAAGVLTLVNGYYTKIEAYSAGNALLDTFLLTEGSGNFIYGSDSIGTLSADAWLFTEVNDNWQAKIDTAKTILKNEIETRLGRQGWRVDFENGQELIDIVTNLSTFTLAHEYLSLSLVYRDLYFNFNTELFKNKSNQYLADYSAELNNCFYRLQIDPNAGESPTVYGDWTQGVITR